MIYETYKNTIQYKEIENPKTYNMIVFGDAGHGKSTALNWIFERYTKLKPEFSD